MPKGRFPAVCGLIFLLLFSLMQCQSRQSDGFVIYKDGMGFALTDNYLVHPLVIGGADGYPVYFETSAGRVSITQEPINVEQSEEKFMATWQVQDRNISLEIQRIPDAISPGKGREYQLSFQADPDSGILRWGIYLHAKSDEYFTGCMERPVEGTQMNGTEARSWTPGVEQALDLRGQRLEMLVKSSMGLYAPFYLSSRGYSLFTHGTWPGVYDFCKTDSSRIEVQFDGPQLRMTLQTSQDPAVLVQAQSNRMGPTFLPPKWAFGVYHWRDNHSNNPVYYDGTSKRAPYNTDLVEDILMLKHFDIPVGIYWVDRPWAKGEYGYDDFIWDPERFPNHQQMIKWVNDQDMQFMLWIAPWVRGEMADIAKNRGYVIPGQIKKTEAFPLIDFSNPEAREWWQEEGMRKILDDGVAAFKLDRADVLVPASRTYYVANGETTQEYHNYYPVDYTKATYEIVREVRGNDFLLMARAGYTGSPRYGAFWGGDIRAPQEGLRAAIIAQQRSAIMGYPIWGSDTGGYWKGLNRETVMRWLAFSCFSPIMEIGPLDDYGMWEMPWNPSYDADLIATYRLYATIHDRLIDYSYKAARESQETGMPIVRPLFLLYPDQEPAWEDWQTYQYGEDILVSAVWKNGKTEHSLYLPAGNDWINAWNGEEYRGGQYVSVSVPLPQIPVFLRKGSTVKLGDLNRLYRQSLKIVREEPNIKSLERQAFNQ